MAGPRQAKKEKDSAKGARILIVEARYYDDLADALLTGAMTVLEKAGVDVERISVPGSLEIPGAIAIALEAARRKRRPYDGIVALGCVIRGDTIHFEIVSHLSAKGLMELSVERRLPIAVPSPIVFGSFTSGPAQPTELPRTRPQTSPSAAPVPSPRPGRSSGAFGP